MTVLAEKCKNLCSVCDKSIEEFEKTYPEIPQGDWMRRGTLGANLYQEYMKSHFKDGVLFTDSSQDFGLFYCMSCILTLVNNPSQEKLIRKD